MVSKAGAYFVEWRTASSSFFRKDKQFAVFSDGSSVSP